ncbi:transketolase [Chromobacterium haemolyticum]|uniref:Transketolase n=1 Tax=Chromobacterium haemolyticum TaxID=394935 RepID=A0ABS3GTH8_9NEIS|nr:transketolase [Chromobacterium haemolyticum]MBK0417253.1 transketolase [Chromobacterium haemolyticum]MBO0418366.1 transketolase [Chromobacterium haemolyticum]MBO0501703.1 transketolase [Chromobacterium haemolyticum]OQS35202.1 transketolase [Chromobacterium haemolyticum]BBH14702.1 transketolase [Chromobacterium haemolyticum]
MNTEELQSMAKTMRHKILEISHACNLSAHLGGGLSMVEIMAVLYGRVLRYEKGNPRWAGRDRFILSKGHGVLGFFSALLAAGLISEETYKTFQTNESDLIAHPVMNLDLGIESSNGSLGQGLSMGVGIALAGKKKQADFRVFVYMGDGECNEGSVWEAVMSAAQLKLDNLTAVVDYNKLQSDGDARQIMDLADLAGKFRAFGWDVRDIDGHDLDQVVGAFEAPREAGKPRVLVAHTVKGKGVSFMENNNEWHHNRLTKVHYEQALGELGVCLETTGHEHV